MISRRVFLSLPAALGLQAGEVQYCGIRFREVENGKSSRRYLWIHGDEKTAGDVLAAHMKTFRGRALLVNNPTRVIAVGSMEFDPNRMFSEFGLRKNVGKLNPEAGERDVMSVVRMVARDRKKLLKRITPPRGGLLIALHNNSRGYSVKDEVELSNATSLKEPDTPHDFLLATDPRDFAKLKESPFNAVLQNEPKGDDDGSLSRIMANRRVRYINIETAIGRFEKQKQMLEWLEGNLP